MGYVVEVDSCRCGLTRAVQPYLACARRCRNRRLELIHEDRARPTRRPLRTSRTYWTGRARRTRWALLGLYHLIAQVVQVALDDHRRVRIRRTRTVRKLNLGAVDGAQFATLTIRYPAPPESAAPISSSRPSRAANCSSRLLLLVALRVLTTTAEPN